MQLAGLLWNGITDDIPSHVTVLDWVEKCGLSITKGCLKKKAAEEAYSIIYDNSITVCGQDLHLELKSSSEHPGHSLRHADVSVLRMKAGKGWDTKMIKGQLEQTIKDEGRKPDYVVSDNGSIMCKAGEALGLTHHKDISHSFGMFLENVYSKDPEFMDFIVKKGNARRFSHTPMASLMPPRRREYARFMNVFDTVHWAKAILENERLLSGRERYMLSFVRDHASLVEELDDVMLAYEYMEQLCKQEGLSHKTALECRRYINQNLMTKGDRVRRLADMLIAYFNREESLLNGDEIHNITSDIIESTFGCFKGRMSPNKNNGYTPLVLLIPLSLRVSTIEDCKIFNVRQLLDKTTITDIKKWRGDNLLPNPGLAPALSLEVILSLQFSDGIKQLLIPVFTKATDEWVAEKLIQRHILLNTFRDGHFTDIPTVVVQANETATQSFLADGIKRTTNRLAESGLTGSERLFQSAETTIRNPS